MTLPPEISAPSASVDVVISEGILAAQREAEALADEMDAEHNEVLPAVPKVLQLPIKVIEQQVQERKGASSRPLGVRHRRLTLPLSPSLSTRALRSQGPAARAAPREGRGVLQVHLGQPGTCVCTGPPACTTATPAHPHLTFAHTSYTGANQGDGCPQLQQRQQRRREQQQQQQ